MKKVLIALAAILLLLLAAIGVVLSLPEEQAAQSGGEASSAASQQPQINVYQRPETDADLLEALDFSTTQNQDTVAWLKIPGTDINDPVLQSYDNAYYLRRDERREEDIYGCYFADYECSIGPRENLSPNTVVYGHSDLQDNPDGPRFSQLFRFADQAFAQQHPTLTFCVLEDWMEWEVVAAGIAPMDVRLIEPEPEGGVSALANFMRQHSYFDYGVPVAEGDRLLTLITCTQDQTTRLVVMARLLGEGEQPPTSANPTPNSAQEA